MGERERDKRLTIRTRRFNCVLDLSGGCHILPLHQQLAQTISELERFYTKYQTIFIHDGVVHIHWMLMQFLNCSIRHLATLHSLRNKRRAVVENLECSTQQSSRSLQYIYPQSSSQILGSSLFADFHILKFVRKFSSCTEINNGFSIRYQLISIHTKKMSTTILDTL